MWYPAFVCTDWIEEVQTAGLTHCPITLAQLSVPGWVTTIWKCFLTAAVPPHDVTKIKSERERRKHWDLAHRNLDLKGKTKYHGRPHRGDHPCEKICLAKNSPNPLRYTCQPARKTKTASTLSNTHLFLPSLLSCNWLSFTSTKWQLCH